MSIFASQTQSPPIPIPFDPPHTVTVRKLTGREVEQAQAEHLKGLIGGKSPRGWSSAFQRILTNGFGSAQDVEQVLSDPLAGYDRLSVVRSGLVGWSYPEARTASVVPAKGETPAVLVDPIADLSDEALEFIATEVMRLTKPERFLTQEAAKAAEKEPEAAPSLA